MYRELIQAYMIAQSEEQNLDNEVGSIARKKEEGKENEVSPTSPSPGIQNFDKPPPDYIYWGKKKQLEYNRKKLMKLKDFYYQEKEQVRLTKKKSFLNDYTKGE